MKAANPTAEVSNIDWKKINCSAMVLLAVLLSAAIFVVPASIAGRKIEDEKHFLRSYRTPSNTEAFLACAADYATKSSEGNDVLFLGSSSCLSGVQSTQFDNLTGLGAHNLSSLGLNNFDVYTFLLRAYLEHHPVPKLLVFCVHPQSLGQTRTPKHPLGDPAAGSSNLRARFFWCYGDDGEYPPPSLGNAVRSHVSQATLSALGDVAGGYEHYLNKPTLDLNGLTYNGLREKISRDRGFYSLGQDKSLPPGSDQSGSLWLPAKQSTPDDPYPVDAQIDADARAFIQFAVARNIPLMIQLAPDLTWPGDVHFAAAEQWFDRLEADFPSLTCSRPATLIYGPEFFSDWYYHLNLRGAEKFTELVAASVTRLLNPRIDGGKATPALNQSTSHSRASGE